MIRIRGVRKSFESQLVLDGVDLVQTTVLLVCFTVLNAGNNSAESIGITEAANL